MPLWFPCFGLYGVDAVAIEMSGISGEHTLTRGPGVAHKAVGSPVSEKVTYVSYYKVQVACYFSITSIISITSLFIPF